MAAVIIRKKDVERLGKELVKEVFEFLHDEYILSNFEEMKEEEKKFLRNLNLDSEICGDLFYKKEAFLNIFKVFDSDYSYLKD